MANRVFACLVPTLMYQWELTFDMTFPVKIQSMMLRKCRNFDESRDFYSRKIDDATNDNMAVFLVTSSTPINSCE